MEPTRRDVRRRRQDSSPTLPCGLHDGRGEGRNHRAHPRVGFMSEDLQATDPEDVKIIDLARASLARSQAREAACVRDTDGRTYAGASVDLPHLRLSAIAGEAHPSESDLALINDLPGEGVAVWSVDAAGVVRGLIES